MSNSTFRVSEYTAELELAKNERNGAGATGAALEEIAAHKLHMAILGSSARLCDLQKLFDPKTGGYGYKLNFRREDLANSAQRASIEKGIRKGLKMVAGNLGQALEQEDESVKLIMEILDVRAARKDVILSGIAEGTADRMAEVLDPSWRPAQNTESSHPDKSEFQHDTYLSLIDGLKKRFEAKTAEERTALGIEWVEVEASLRANSISLRQIFSNKITMQYEMSVGRVNEKTITFVVVKGAEDDNKFIPPIYEVEVPRTRA